MSNLVCWKPVDLRSVCWTEGPEIRGVSEPRSTQPEEPVYVHVRVRQYGGIVPQNRQACPNIPDLGRLPVGTSLDCYV
jgi:hypothetical protein